MERTLAIAADVSEIGRVNAVLEDIMRTYAFSRGEILDLQLAVEEAIANTVTHGYPGGSGSLTVVIHAARTAVEVRIEDQGVPFNPLALPDPDRASDLDTRRIGGLGIYLLRQVVDEASYRYVGGKNVLTLAKRKAAAR